MSLYKEHLLVYGGININEDISGTPFKSNQLRMYKIQENKWLENFELKQEFYGKKKSTPYINFPHHERYGHESFVFNNSIYIFAGFNGLFLNDLFKFNLNSLELLNVNQFFSRKKRREIFKSINEESDSSNAPSIKFKSLKFQSYLNQQSLLSSQQQQLHNTFSDEDIFGNKIASKPSSPNFYDYYSANHDQSIDFIAVYDSKTHTKQLIESCSKYRNCQICHQDAKCVWNLNQCEHFSVLSFSNSNSSDSLNNSILEANLTNESVVYKKPTCSQMCDEFKSCSNCTLSNSRFKNECVWCASQSKCVLGSALHILYPFGECFTLVNKRTECERNYVSVGLNTAHFITNSMTPSINTNSNSYQQSFCEIQHSNCSSCITDERCGWCSLDSYDLIESINIINKSEPFLFNYSLNTGYGTCMEVGFFI